MRDNFKVLFLNPPLSAKNRYGALSQAGSSEPPLGLAYLAGVARQSGYSAAILDAQALGIDVEETLDLILSRKPDIVAITLTTLALKNASRLAAFLKKKNPKIKIIVGGCHFTSLPQDTLRDNPAFDFGIIGEGERTLISLLKSLANNESVKGMQGLVLRIEEEIVVNPMPQRIKNLDELPLPAFDLLPELGKFYRTTTQSVKYMPTVSLMASRGCCGQCSFCDRAAFGNEIRMHSAGYIADMIEKLQKDFAVKGIIFEDDNFMLSEQRLSDLKQLLSERKIKIAWSAMSRVDSINEEKLKIAKSFGCWQIAYGIESGSQEILDFYKKRTTISQIKKAVELTKKIGISPKAFFMVGNPTETVKTLDATLDLITQLPLDDISVTFFTPYPGSEIWGSINDYGTRSEDWDNYSCFHPVFIPKGFCVKEIEGAQKKILKRFYSQPRVMFSYLKRLHSVSQFKELYKSWRMLSGYCRTAASIKKLVINMDDFGLCEGINSGISKAIENRFARSVSLMPTGLAYDSAVKSLKKSGFDIAVGVHVSLVATKPVSGPAAVSSLIGNGGFFHKDFFAFFTNYISGKMKKEHIEKELRAQILRIKESGLKITHLDSHQHIHMIPGIFSIVVNLAEEYEIPFIRLPSVPFAHKYYIKARGTIFRKLAQCVLNILSFIYKPILRKHGLQYCDNVFGFIESGHMNMESFALALKAINSPRNELFCHPGQENEELMRLIGGWKYTWTDEFGLVVSDEIAVLLEQADVILDRFKQK